MIRRSIRSLASRPGIGLFTQASCNLTINPAAAHTGIVFERTGSSATSAATPIKAHISNLSTVPIHPAFTSLPPRNTILSSHNEVVVTVEHVLSALAGLGITDARIELDGPEVPIFDGSSRAIVEMIMQAGVVDLDAQIDPIVVRKAITVRNGEGWITAEPTSGGCSFTYELDYGQDSSIHAQTATWSGDTDEYQSLIAPARTFSLEHEAKAMQGLGLFTAFTPKDLLVIGEQGPIDNEWRFENEPARHKLLDLIGDLSLAGAPICAHITAHKSGHALNHEMAKQLAAL